MENFDYIPPYEITTEMVDYISKICERIGEINSLNSNQQINLLRRNRIHSIHSSLAIENNSLSLNQVTDIVNGKMVVGDRREILEVKNALDAYDMIDFINPYAVEDMKRIHLQMMKGLVLDAGEFRDHAEGVFDGDQPIHIAPPTEMVSSLIEKLFNYLNDSADHILIKSCVFHYEFEYIHPFSDGNGRMGRFWQTAILSHWRPAFNLLPIENILKANQNDYYESIRVSNAEGKSNAFILFMLKVILQALSAVETNSNIDMDDKVMKLLNAMDLRKYTTKELMELLNMKSRISFREHYLQPALQSGLIQMIDPEHPNNRNQKYFKIR